MKKVSLAAALLILLVQPSFAQENAPSGIERKGQIGLQMSVNRSWSVSSTKADSDPGYQGRYSSTNNYIGLLANYLFLNRHVHAGPIVSYSRGYDSDSNYTNFGLGAQVKFTLDDLQTCMQTPFLSVDALLSRGKGQYSEKYETEGERVGPVPRIRILPEFLRLALQCHSLGKGLG